MDKKAFDISKMTVEDLFRAKAQRRQRLASLPFEQKIEIVKKLRAAVLPIRRVREDRADTEKSER